MVPKPCITKHSVYAQLRFGCGHTVAAVAPHASRPGSPAKLVDDGVVPRCSWTPGQGAVPMHGCLQHPTYSRACPDKAENPAENYPETLKSRIIFLRYPEHYFHEVLPSRTPVGTALPHVCSPIPPQAGKVHHIDTCQYGSQDIITCWLRIGMLP